MLPTGVPGLDDVLGGGLPEYSFNVIAGEPGSGKTTMAHQIMFSNSTPERCALYFTVLGEPPIKMLRYQQQFSFFDPDKLDGAIRFVNLSQEVMEQDLGVVLDRIVREVEETSPGVVVVDSFRSVARAAQTFRAVSWSCSRFCSALRFTSQAGKPPRSWWVSTRTSRQATTRCSPWPTACSGCPRAWIATRSFASFRW
jgi:circadian clock protein KaiC